MNAREERMRALRGRLEGWREEGFIDQAGKTQITAELEVPWRSHGVIVQIVFFLLTCVAMVASNELFDGIFTGALGLAVAEYLILRRRWFWTGVEAALWVGGIVSLISELPRTGSREAILVLAAGLAIAGARVRNPIFGAVAAALVVVYAEQRFDLGVVVALAIAAAAVLALLRTWRRPSTEWLWIAIAILVPLVGRLMADARWRTTTIALYLVFGSAALVLAIVKRHHALFFSAAIALAIAGVDVAARIDLHPEGKFAIAGALLLSIAAIVTRALRGKTRGFVATPARLTPFDDVVDMAGAIAAADATRVEPAESRPSGDGGFGGAGATGDY